MQPLWEMEWNCRRSSSLDLSLDLWPKTPKSHLLGSEIVPSKVFSWEKSASAISASSKGTRTWLSHGNRAATKHYSGVIDSG